MKTFKTLLALGSFIAMYFYVQSEENKAKNDINPQYTSSKMDSTYLNLKNSNANNFDKSISIKK